MIDISKNWKSLPAGKQNLHLEKIIRFFKKEHDLKIGMMPAEEILEAVLEIIGADIYNIAIEDSRDALRNSFDDFSISLDLLKK